MIEIGTKCRINLSETEYEIIDVRKKDITIRIDENTTHQIIDYFVDLEEIESLRMVARKGNKDLPQHIIDKMRRKHNQGTNDPE